jgi:hypothetical protein
MLVGKYRVETHHYYCYTFLDLDMDLACKDLLVLFELNNSVSLRRIKVITKLPNSEQSYKGKVKTHNHINRQNQSTNRNYITTLFIFLKNLPNCVGFRLLSCQICVIPGRGHGWLNELSSWIT